MSLLKSLIPPAPRASNGATASSSEPVAAVKPVYEIKETPDAFDLTVYLPGVAKDGLEITAEDGQVRVFGRRAFQAPASWTPLHRESGAAPFELVLSHDNAIDADRVGAELRDGVLRVSLPKHEALKPRKITVS